MYSLNFYRSTIVFISGAARGGGGKMPPILFWAVFPVRAIPLRKNFRGHTPRLPKLFSVRSSTNDKSRENAQDVKIYCSTCFVSNTNYPDLPSGLHIYVTYQTPAELTFLFYSNILTNPIVDYTTGKTFAGSPVNACSVEPDSGVATGGIGGCNPSMSLE